jgi:hypothetical protein
MRQQLNQLDNQVKMLEAMLQKTTDQVKTGKPVYRRAKRTADRLKKIEVSQEVKVQKQKEIVKKTLIREVEKKKASAFKETKRIEFEKENAKKLANRVINTAELIPVRLDKNTVIYIKPGRDPEAIKLKFKNRS